MSILVAEHLKKVYSARASNKTEALRGLSFMVEEGEFVAVMGESGSGKTTLLNILSTLDSPTGGKVYLDGKDMAELKEKELADFRRENMGFVFQDFNLLNTFSLKDNILLPMVLSGKSLEEMGRRLNEVTPRLGLGEILEKYPYEVSGGQKQRTAVARALMMRPRLLFADEPTGALDSKAADGLLSLFTDINAGGQTILLVTHSAKAASHAGRVLFIKDGELYNELYRGEESPARFYSRISDALALLFGGGNE